MPRFIFSILLLLLALLTLMPAPVYILWYVAILVGELPWVFIGITIIMLFLGFRFNYLQLISTVILICALVLFLHPIAAAYKRAWKIDKEMAAAFDPVEKNAVQRKPFSLFRMFSSAGKEEPYKRMTYDTTHQLTLDYYPATGTGIRPCVVVIHGGSWRNGDSRQLPELNSILAKSGYNVAAINYRKVPEYKSPAPVEDLHAALVFLHENAAALQLDTTHFVLLGRSAGGQIALMGAYTMQDMGIKGVIDYYGPADMVWGYQNPANPWVYNSCEVLEDYMGGSYEDVPKRYGAGSPIEFVNAQSVPTLMIYGKNDVWVAYGHSTRLSAKLEQYHVPHYLLSFSWATHGFDYFINGPGGQLATYSVLRFLKRILGAPGAVSMVVSPGM